MEQLGINPRYFPEQRLYAAQETPDLITVGLKRPSGVLQQG